jgi:hypothetical protein
LNLAAIRTSLSPALNVSFNFEWAAALIVAAHFISAISFADLNTLSESMWGESDRKSRECGRWCVGKDV